MRGCGDYNYRKLLWFQGFNSVAIALGANWVVSDMILLRADFDLVSFGVVKSSMFLLPALSYWAAAGVLRRWNRDRLVCFWSYLARAVLPLGIPVCALLTREPGILFAVFLIVFSGGYTCAMFANNSLLTIYKSALHREDFNCRSSVLSALPGLVSSLAALAAVVLLERSEGADFFRLLLILQLVMLAADLPAMTALIRVRIPEQARPEPIRLSEWTLPFRDTGFRPLLGFGFLHAVWTGLLSTYLVVYLLKVKGFSPFWVILLELGLLFAVAAGASSAGRLVDRCGYAPVMMAGAGIMAAASFCWVLRPASPVLLALFLFLVYNGNNGFLSLTLRNLEGNAAAALAGAGEANHYVAAFSLNQSLGSFFGCLFAGSLLALMPGEGSVESFHGFFAAASVVTVAMTVSALHWFSKRRWYDK